MSELLIIFTSIIIILITYIIYKFLSNQELIYFGIILNIIACILHFKITTFFNSNVNLGIIPLLGYFTILYILIIKKNKKDLQKMTKLTLYCNIFIAIMIILFNSYIPTLIETKASDINQIIYTNFKLIICYPLIVLASAYSISKLLNMLLNIEANSFLSIILTYIITSLIYTIVYYIIGYIKILPLNNAIFLSISTYIFGLLITIINALFVYIITKKKVKK